ncbi:MAG: ferredoxin [Spirochaetota bacterium]
MAETRYRAIVDQTRCIGCGLCEETMPDVFRLGDYAASVVKSVLAADRWEELVIVTRDCPVGAISVENVPEDETSGNASGDDDQKRENEEEDGEIGEYKRKHGDLSDRNQIEPDDPQDFQRGEHNFSIVRNGTNDD